MLPPIPASLPARRSQPVQPRELVGHVLAQRLHLLRWRLSRRGGRPRSRARRRAASDPASASPAPSSRISLDRCRRPCRSRSHPRSSSSWRSRGSRSGPPPRRSDHAHLDAGPLLESPRAARRGSRRRGSRSCHGVTLDPDARQNAANTSAVPPPARCVRAGAAPPRPHTGADPRARGSRPRASTTGRLPAVDDEPERVRAHVDDGSPAHRARG